MLLFSLQLELTCYHGQLVKGRGQNHTFYKSMLRFYYFGRKIENKIKLWKFSPLPPDFLSKYICPSWWRSHDVKNNGRLYDFCWLAEIINFVRSMKSTQIRISLFSFMDRSKDETSFTLFTWLLASINAIAFWKNLFYFFFPQWAVGHSLLTYMCLFSYEFFRFQLD